MLSLLGRAGVMPAGLSHVKKPWCQLLTKSLTAGSKEVLLAQLDISSGESVLSICQMVTAAPAKWHRHSGEQCW